MAKTLPQLKLEVQGIVKDSLTAISSDDFNNAIAYAVRILSRKSPLAKYYDRTGDATSFYWTIPSNYEIGFSYITGVQCPYLVTDIASSGLRGSKLGSPYLLSTQYDIFQSADGTYAFRLDFQPSTSDVVRFHFTARHSVTTSASTILTTDDEDSVIFLAASYCFKLLQAKANNTNDTSLNADLVNLVSRSSEYGSLATFYEEQSGLGGYLETEGAAIFGDAWVLPTQHKTNYLTHA